MLDVRLAKALPHAAVANDRVGRPEQRMGIGELGFAVGADVRRTIHQQCVARMSEDRMSFPK